MKVGDVISMEWIRGESEKAAQGSDPELWLELRMVLRESLWTRSVWRLQTTWMFSLVTHSLWQPIKPSVSAGSVINLSDTAPKSKFQRLQHCWVPGEWKPGLCQQLPGPCRACPSPRVPGAAPRKELGTGRDQGSGIPALIPSPAPQPEPRVLLQPPQHNPALRMSLIYTTWILERGRKNLSAMFWSTLRGQ